MHNAESEMEKGEAGFAESPTLSTTSTSPIKTSPTSRNSSAPLNSVSPLRGPQRNLPSWNLLSRRRQRRKQYHVPVKTRRINDHPKGYPNLAAFLDSDEGFTMYRRFGYLQSRLLLDKQEELRILEEKLGNLDLEIARDDDEALCSRTLFGPNAAKHRKILSDIERTFCSYAKILAAAQQTMAFNKPSDSEYESVGRYLDNRKSLDTEEATWIRHKEDIITLRAGREHAWLDDVVEGFLKYCHCKLIDKIFRSEETRKKAEIDGDMPGKPPKDEDKYELYYTPSRIARLANGILTFLVLVLLVLPIYVLYHMVHDIGTRKAYLICIGTLLVFTLAFSSVLSLFTKAKRHEILAASAAYCAVLVVFLGDVVPTDSHRP